MFFAEDFLFYLQKWHNLQRVTLVEDITISLKALRTTSRYYLADGLWSWVSLLFMIDRVSFT